MHELDYKLFFQFIIFIYIFEFKQNIPLLKYTDIDIWIWTHIQIEKKNVENHS